MELIRLPSSFPELEFGVVPTHISEGGTPVTPYWQLAMGVNPTEHVDEASTAGQVSDRLRSHSACGTSFTGILRQTDVYEALPDIFGTDEWAMFLSEMESTAVPRPKTPGYLEYELILRETFNDIHYGRDPQEALDAAVLRIEREFRKYR